MYKRGDLVWAKMKGFPPWPGIIAAPPQGLKKQPSKKCTLYHCIYFFGSKNYSWIEAHKLDRYKKGTGTISTGKRSAGLREAIEAIDAYIENGEGGEDFDITPEVDIFDKLLNECKASETKNSSPPPFKKKFKQNENESDGHLSDSSSGSIAGVISTSAVNLKNPLFDKLHKDDKDKESEKSMDKDSENDGLSVVTKTIFNEKTNVSEKININIDKEPEKLIDKDVSDKDGLSDNSSTKTVLETKPNVSEKIDTNVQKDNKSDKIKDENNVSDKDDLSDCLSSTKTVLETKPNVSGKIDTNVEKDKPEKINDKDNVSDRDEECSSSVVVNKVILKKNKNISEKIGTHKVNNQSLKVTNKDIMNEKVLDKGKELVKDLIIKKGPSCSKDIKIDKKDTDKIKELNFNKRTNQLTDDDIKLAERTIKEMANLDEIKYKNIVLGLKKYSYVNLGERVPIGDYWIRSVSPEVKSKVPTPHAEHKKKHRQQVVKARPFRHLPKVIKVGRGEGCSTSSESTTKKRNHDNCIKSEPKKKKRMESTAATEKVTISNNAEDTPAGVTLHPLPRPDTPRLDLFTVSQSLLDKHITPSTLRFGFLGLGIMGSAMVKNLLNSGHRVIVWNRTPDKCRAFAKVGAEMAVTPQDVCTAADIIFSCVAGPKAAKDLVFGNCGALAQMNPSKAYVEMTNIDTETSLDINEAIMSRGARYLEAQIQGSLEEAEEGRLVLLCAGDRSLYDECHSCFEAIGYSSFFFGDVGNATKMNLVIQMMCATVIAGLAESMALIEKFGLLQSDMIEILNLTPLKSKLIMDKANFMKNCTFPTNMALSHMQTDISMGINSAEDIGVPTPIFSAVNEEFKQTKYMGYGDHDVAALYIRSRY